MCKFKSAIILKDRVFIPDYDHHTDMLEELGIADTRENAERLFVRAELIPANGDVFSNIDDWYFNVDQDIQPEWFVAEYEKQRMIKAVKGWAETHIFIGKNGLEIKDNKNCYIKDCKNVVIDNSTVEAWGNSTVKALGNSTVVKPQYSSFNASHLILSENSTFKDCVAKVIYQSGNYKLVTVTDGKIN